MMFKQGTVIKHQNRLFSKFDLFGKSFVPAEKQQFVPKSGNYPKGFLAGSINVGIKPDNRSQPDLILVASEKPACGAAVFTKNEFPAASITISKELISRTKGHGLRGIIANSWCANTLTGQVGIEDALAMSNMAHEYVTGNTQSEQESSVMVMHTGLGGQRLPIDNIMYNIPKLWKKMGDSHEHWLEAAKGICTTDTFPKMVSRKFNLPSSRKTTFSIAGITKGAGMVHPNMATTLGIICTDAPITPSALQELLSHATNKSYNCISIDGDTSTNDMVAMIANGAAGGQEVSFQPSASSQSEDFVSLQRTLNEFMAEMAKLVVRDGGGATKFITIRVRGSPSYEAAKQIASVIARSVLVKTGIYGKDPNWGGILAALGYSLLDTKFAGKGIIIPELTSISFVPADGTSEILFLQRGIPTKVDDVKVNKVMSNEDIEVVVNLRDDGKRGRDKDIEAVYWTCDLSHDFVTINGGFKI